MKIIKESFFQRPTEAVARELLGKYLVRQGRAARMITDVEVYDGFDDTASHARFGKTSRSSVMFEAGGKWYVYLVYGMYHMLNITTGREDYPAAILIRGLEGVNGPGKICRELGIDRTFNGRISQPGSGLSIEDRGIQIAPRAIKRAARIGVSYAGPVWSTKKWRFYLS